MERKVERVRRAIGAEKTGSDRNIQRSDMTLRWVALVAMGMSVSLASGQTKVTTFTFEGTAAGSNAVVLFGHAFPRGTVPAGKPVVLRHPDSGALYRLQMNPLIRWPDGSVKTALLAAELPELANEATLDLDFVVGQAHPNPGPALSFPERLTARSARIKTWAPGNTKTPLWEFDPLARIGADRWHEGPLAVSTRVETPVPSRAVLDTSDQTGKVESVRLITDLLVTKDGILELDVGFSNDRLPFRGSEEEKVPTCGIARFGYTIEIDGQVVYDQRPAEGAGRDLLMWSQWMRRRGRRADGLAIHAHAHWRENATRPFVRPDIRLIIASGVMANYDLEGAVDPLRYFPPGPQGRGDVEPTVINDPYWPWSLCRGAGDPGGRPEIGYRHQYTYLWLRTGHRLSQIWMQKAFEAAATRGMYYYDWPLARWANPEDYPKLSLTPHASSPETVLRPDALGLPPRLRATHNVRDHITIDQAHHGSFNWGPALLAGRRLGYDGLMARSMWATMDQQDRWNGVTVPPETGGPNWRTLTPDPKTGVAWSAIVGMAQVRSWGWNLRDIVDAAVILPENWPHRVLAVRNAEAWLNAAAAAADILNARHGNLGFFHVHTGGDGIVPWMMTFGVMSLVTAQSAGIVPEATAKVFRETARFHTGGFTQAGNFYRLFLAARGLLVSFGGRYFSSWEEIRKANMKPTGWHDPIPDDWPVQVSESDWQRNMQVALTYFATDRTLPLEVRAMAADALVLARSERGNPAIDAPALSPGGRFGAFLQSNSLIAPGLTWGLDRAPQIEPGQHFVVAGDAMPGTLFGVLNWTGPTPRCSAQGLNAPEDAFEIVSQPAGNPFRVSRGGALFTAGSLPAGVYTLQIRCRTYSRPKSGPETEYVSEPVPVTVEVAAAPPLIPPAAAFRVMETRPVDFVIGRFPVRGNPGTVEIVSGNEGGWFAVSSPPVGQRAELKVASSLKGRAGQSRELTVRARNPHGTAEQKLRVEIAAEVKPPALTPEQTIEYIETPEAGALVGELRNTGGIPETVVIVSGDPHGQFALAVEGGTVRLRGGAHGVRRLRADRTANLKIEAANVAGQSEATVTIHVRHNSIFDERAPEAVIIGAWSTARRLVKHYRGPLIRVRRSSDNAEEDIGIDVNGELDVAALRQFVGNGDGFVCRVYDQSVENLPMAQDVPGDQPRIVQGGELVTVGSRGRPALDMGVGRGTNIGAGPGIPYMVREYLPWEFAIAIVLRPSVPSGDAGIVGMWSDLKNPWGWSGASISMKPNGLFLFNDGNPGFAISVDTQTYQAEATYGLLGRLYRVFPSSEHGRRMTIIGSEGLASNHAGSSPFRSDGSCLRLSPFPGRTPEVVIFRRLAAVTEEQAILENMAAFYGIGSP